MKHSKGNVVCEHRYTESRKPTLVNKNAVTQSKAYLPDRCRLTHRPCSFRNGDSASCTVPKH